MTRDIKYLVLALAMAATAGAIAPPSLRGVKDASVAETQTHGGKMLRGSS